MQSLTYKTIFLVSVTAARRVSELEALSINLNLCIFHSDKFCYIPTPPSYQRSTPDSREHRSWLYHLSAIIQKENWNLFGTSWVRRVLKHYLERTKAFCKTDCLFVLFKRNSMGKCASRKTLSHWLKGTIVLAYLSTGKTPPARIMAHSICSAATSAAFEGIASI